jgi:4-amino-4-deoxy-L-arabinose transferase-like glycosyltransferase
VTVAGPLLPVIAMIAIWYLVYGHRASLSLDRLSRRGCLVIAFVVMQLLVALISEGTSLGRHFSVRGVGAAWLVVDVVAVFLAVRLFRRGPGVRIRLSRLMDGVRATSVWERVLAGLAAAQLGVLTAIAWLYDTPVNSDSLVYHLARVMHWIQNGSVHHYATHYASQNEFSPLHEYNMAHLHLLAGGTDALDAFVQLLAAVVCVVGASEIARLLGGDRRTQILAAALAATIPSLILEATSTQNNDFAAAIAVAVLVALLAWRPTGRFVIGAAFIGTAAGAGVLAKGTLAVFTGAMGLVVIAVAVTQHARSLGALVVVRRVLLSGLVAVVAGVVVAGPFLARNVEVYGGFTGPYSRTTLSSDLTPAAAAANTVRSVASNFQIGDGSGVESWISRAVLGGLESLYEPFDIDPNDSHYMVGDLGDAFKPGDYSRWQRSEAIGSNPWHVVLILVALIGLAVFVIRGDRRMRVPLLLGLALAATFLIFTAVTRWTPYGVRYQIPVLVAWCPLIALVIARANRAVGAVLVVGLLALATPMLLNSYDRSLVHPAWNKGTGIEPYFHPWDNGADIPAIAAGEQAVANVIAGTPCTSVGLANWVFYEYPIWIALRNGGWRGRIDHVMVEDASKVLANPDLGPCALIRQVDAEYVTRDGEMVSWRFGPMTVSMLPGLVNDKTPDQAGFHSDVAGVRVLPGFNWRLADNALAIKDFARIHLFSDAERTVRVQAVGSTVPIEGWQQSRFGDYEMSVRLRPGANTLDLRAVQGKVSPLSGIKILPM